METRKAKQELFKTASKPSQLIELALNDLEAVERDSGYVIEMERLWHHPRHDGACAVCLAGGIMAMRFGARPDEDSSPMEFFEDGRTARRVASMNYFRSGYVGAAFEYLADDPLLGFDSHLQAWWKGLRFDRRVTPYADNPDGFKARMRQLVSDLREAGY